MCGAPARAGWSVSRTVIAPPWQSGTEKTLRGTRAAGPARSVLVGASRSSSLDVFTLHQRSPFAAVVAAALSAVGIAGAGIARPEVLTPPWRRLGPPAPLKRRRIHTSRVDQPSVTVGPVELLCLSPAGQISATTTEQRRRADQADPGVAQLRRADASTTSRAIRRAAQRGGRCGSSSLGYRFCERRGEPSP